MLKFLSNQKNILRNRIIKNVSLKQFASKDQRNISDKLSFLNTEQEMRKYFNIIDWEKKEVEELVKKDMDMKKNIYLEEQRKSREVDEVEVLQIFQKFKRELNLGDKDQQKTPAPSKKKKLGQLQNDYELINEFSLEGDVKYIL